ncbi:unnamed protein product [Diamesa serratosioi]
MEDLIIKKIELANGIVEKLAKFQDIDGALKVKRNIIKEIQFLQKLKIKSKESDEDEIKRKLQCTNLNFFNHLVNSLYNYPNIKNLNYPVRNSRNSDEQPIRVDIICVGTYSSMWVKIIARNSESISDGVNGRLEYGNRDIFEVAESFLEAAEMNHFFFRSPRVVFDFLNPIDESLEKSLEDKGILIGRKYRNSNLFLDSIEDVDVKLNLDVTTMLAYVSELSNGGSNWKFNEKLLNEQADQERKEPIKPILDKFFDRKSLICCETAVNSFKEIVDLLGGISEKQRADDLLNRVELLPDVKNPEHIITIDLSAQIKERSRKIFAFGINHKAITISSNYGFSRAAKMKCLDIPVYLHTARALTEKKQIELLDS